MRAASATGSNSGAGPFNPGPRDHALAACVHLGPPSPGSSEELIQRYGAGENILSLRQVLKRFVEAYQFSGNEVFDPAFYDTWPPLWRHIARFFVFGVGGFRAKITDHTVAVVGATTVRTGTGDSAEPMVFQVSASSPIVEVTLPTISNYPVWVIGGPLVPHVNLPLAIVRRTVAGVPVSSQTLWLAVADDLSFFGLNYLGLMNSTTNPGTTPVPATLAE